MSPKGIIKVTLEINGNYYSDFPLADWAYRTDFFAEDMLKHFRILINDEFFKEYDFSNPDTKQFIIGCNSWHDIP